MDTTKRFRIIVAAGAIALAAIAAGCIPPRGVPPELGTTTTSSTSTTIDPNICDVEPNDTVATAQVVPVGQTFKVCNNGTGDSGVDFFDLGTFTGASDSRLTVDCATTPSLAGQIIGINRIENGNPTPLGAPVGCVDDAIVLDIPYGHLVLGIVSTTPTAEAQITTTFVPGS